QTTDRRRATYWSTSDSAVHQAASSHHHNGRPSLQRKPSLKRVKPKPDESNETNRWSEVREKDRRRFQGELEEAKERLSRRNQKKEEEVRKAQDRIRADREDFETKTASLKEYAFTFSSSATEVATRERSLSALTLSSRSTEIEARERSFNPRVIKLEARERSFDSRLSALKAREAAAYTSKMDLELKLAGLEKKYERESPTKYVLAFGGPGRASYPEDQEL
ncbi:unnamed protein product, partial [Tilletia laevis]